MLNFKRNIFIHSAFTFWINKATPAQQKLKEKNSKRSNKQKSSKNSCPVYFDAMFL